MEFLQWLKIYHDQVTSGVGVVEYNAEERRALSKGGNEFMRGGKAQRTSARAKPSSARPTAGGSAAAPSCAAHRERLGHPKRAVWDHTDWTPRGSELATQEL